MKNTRNTLGNLNDHLFEQLERLNDENLSGERLYEELERAKGITVVASQIIQNGNLILKANSMNASQAGADFKSSRILEG